LRHLSKRYIPSSERLVSVIHCLLREKSTMVDYTDSSQLNLWLFQSTLELRECRIRANQKARQYLISLENTQDDTEDTEETPAEDGDNAKASSKDKSPPPVECFACGYSKRKRDGQAEDPIKDVPETNGNGHPFLTDEEEATLVSFYVSRLPALIGPEARVGRLRRESKVTATAAMLVRRFFCSNSVMLTDPKIIMTAAAFLGLKVEDAHSDVRYLEQGTALMNAPVKTAEIIPAEIALLAGTHFDLLCFHPYKAVLALTEDMRTYLKSEKGKVLVQNTQSDRPLSGQDLKPIYDTARDLLDDAVVSDIPLLYNPGQVGLAALMVAQERVLQTRLEQQDKDAMETDDANQTPSIPRIDLLGYARQRFEGQAAADGAHFDAEELEQNLSKLCDMLRSLKDGEHGCGNYTASNPEKMAVLKQIHKKLKKVRCWGKEESSKKKKGSKLKKKKKRDREEAEEDADPEPPSKKQAT